MFPLCTEQYVPCGLGIMNELISCPSLTRKMRIFPSPLGWQVPVKLSSL